jgi:2-iminoacetate synthase
MSFELQEEAVATILRQARALAPATALPVLDGNGPGLSVTEMAALFYSPHDAETLREAAIACRGRGVVDLETFSPLYLTNTCDSECKMCGMRRDNRDLERQTASPVDVQRQLEILAARGVFAVGLLTGEYRRATRHWSIGLTRDALRRALALGFRHILINIGSLEERELADLLADVPRGSDGCTLPKVTLCTFQETYDRESYRRFMGDNPDNPRSDFERRLANFDRAARAGMRVVNPGVLLGLNADLAYELTALALHVRHLLALGLEVYVSVPRLRHASGAENSRGVSDEEFVRFVAILSLGLPDAKIVITTRESSEVQRRVLPMVSVLSAGSSAVAPYTETGARFPLEASQFEVIDQRPIETILGEYIAEGVRFENYEAP